MSGCPLAAVIMDTQLGTERVDLLLHNMQPLGPPSRWQTSPPPSLSRLHRSWYHATTGTTMKMATITTKYTTTKIPAIKISLTPCIKLKDMTLDSSKSVNSVFGQLLNLKTRSISQRPSPICCLYIPVRHLWSRCRPYLNSQSPSVSRSLYHPVSPRADNPAAALLSPILFVPAGSAFHPPSTRRAAIGPL